MRFVVWACAFALALILVLSNKATAENAKGKDPSITVTLYYPQFQVSTADSLALIVELRNRGDAPIVIRPDVNIALETQAIAGQAHATEERLVAPNADDEFAAEIKLSVPPVEGYTFPGTIGSPRLSQNLENVKLEPGKSLLSRIDLPTGMFPPGVSTVQLVIKRKGQVLGTSKETLITCRAAK